MSITHVQKLKVRDSLKQQATTGLQCSNFKMTFVEQSRTGTVDPVSCCEIEKEFLYISESLNESVVDRGNITHVVAIGNDIPGLSEFRIPNLIIDTNSICENLCNCISVICDFVNTSVHGESENGLETPDHPASNEESTPSESQDNEGGRGPHSRYSSYDSTATRTPPHAGFTWRNVGTPSSCGTISRSASTPGRVSPVREDIDNDASARIDSVDASSESVHTTVRNPVFSTPARGGGGLGNVAGAEAAQSGEESRAPVVLVVCHADDFRSTALVSALLMQVMRMSLRDALAKVRDTAPPLAAAPTEPCVEALLAFEKTLNPSAASNSVSHRELMAGRGPEVAVSASAQENPAPVDTESGVGRPAGTGTGTASVTDNSQQEPTVSPVREEVGQKTPKTDSACACCLVM